MSKFNVSLNDDEFLNLINIKLDCLISQEFDNNHEKLNVEVIVPHKNKDVKFEYLECQILYRIKGEEKSLLLFTEAVR